MLTQNDQIRALVNDQAGYVFNDDVLTPLVQLALTRVPFIVAGLAAMSRGNEKLARAFFSLAIPKELTDDHVSDRREQQPDRD